MATQPVAIEETPEVVEDTNDNAPRDHEAEARQHGWVPKDEFKGDDSRWVDAETFNKRADEVMPLLKKQNAHLKRELDEVKRQARRITDHFNKAEERIRSELMVEMERAVESGDLDAFRKAKAESDKIGEAAPASSKHTPEEALEAFDAFREANPWYDRANLKSASDDVVEARLYADRMTEKHLDKTKDMAPAEFFSFIEGLVVEKFPAIKSPAPRAKPASDVSGVTNGRNPGPRGRTFNDLPVEAQRMADKWIKSGLIKDRAAYLSSYDWS